jgi:lipopolysaccharide export LptBFGC system permease protein LptF
MMTGMGSIVTATFGALIIFALAIFARAALTAKDAQAIARSDWHDFLAMPIHTLAVYALVFGVFIAIIYGLRSLARR